MRYGIISDIHSNLEGLTAVLESLEEARVDSILCCGDIVGYGAEPVACLEMLLSRDVVCIKGNHERGLVDLAEDREPAMNELALAAIEYSEQQLEPENKMILLGFPDLKEINSEFYIFHGSPTHPDDYIFDPFDAQYAFKSLRTHYHEPANHLGFVGHTHVCAIYLLEREAQKLVHGEVSKPGRIGLPENHDVIINVGSCGQYRGGMVVASFCVYNSEERAVEFHFVEYDVGSAMKKIHEAGLPTELADRLALGM